jgi:soluble lytic murein transglycosylase
LASRESIYAIEVMMKTVPDDFHPALLPVVVRRLLYPRYFFAFIAEDSKKYEADPALVLSIMREESRFNPRAKSQAAARGLLQFIITTARDIGRDIGLVDVEPEDLYDPRVIIQLGAKYIAELAEQFGGNRYRTAAAYNAGPKQVALWSRLQPAEGDDYFMTAVNFDETKGYVRKVLNSYEMYGSIY